MGLYPIVDIYNIEQKKNDKNNQDIHESKTLELVTYRVEGINTNGIIAIRTFQVDNEDRDHIKTEYYRIENKEDDKSIKNIKYVKITLPERRDDIKNNIGVPISVKKIIPDNGIKSSYFGIMEY